MLKTKTSVSVAAMILKGQESQLEKIMKKREMTCRIGIRQQETIAKLRREKNHPFSNIRTEGDISFQEHKITADAYLTVIPTGITMLSAKHGGYSAIFATYAKMMRDGVNIRETSYLGETVVIVPRFGGKAVVNTNRIYVANNKALVSWNFAVLLEDGKPSELVLVFDCSFDREIYLEILYEDNVREKIAKSKKFDSGEMKLSSLPRSTTEEIKQVSEDATNEISYGFKGG